MDVDICRNAFFGFVDLYFVFCAPIRRDLFERERNANGLHRGYVWIMQASGSTLVCRVLSLFMGNYRKSISGDFFCFNDFVECILCNFSGFMDFSPDIYQLCGV